MIQLFNRTRGVLFWIVGKANFSKSRWVSRWRVGGTPTFRAFFRSRAQNIDSESKGTMFQNVRLHLMRDLFRDWDERLHTMRKQRGVHTATEREERRKKSIWLHKLRVLIRRWWLIKCLKTQFSFMKLHFFLLFLNLFVALKWFICNAASLSHLAWRVLF